MPYLNYHSARIKNPDLFEEFATKEIADGIMIILGIRKSGGKKVSETQAYRFEKSKFTPQQARAWLKKHNISGFTFEEASKEKKQNAAVVVPTVFDTNAAKASLINWATQIEGGIGKAILGKYFVQINGDGRSEEHYQGPLAQSPGGAELPVFSKEGILEAFNDVSGLRSGVANRSAQRRLVNLYAREFGRTTLPDSMKDFMKRHMSSSLDFIAMEGGLGGVLYEDDEIIERATVITRSGTWMGTDGQPRRKTYDQLKDSAKWFEGVPLVLYAHSDPLGELGPGDRRVGHLRDVRPRDDREDLFAISRFFKEDLTNEEIEHVRTPESINGSPCYRCNHDNIPGVDNFGRSFVDTESGPYYVYEYAVLFDQLGACSTADKCGLIANASPKINDEKNGDAKIQPENFEGDGMVDSTKEPDKDPATQVKPIEIKPTEVKPTEVKPVEKAAIPAKPTEPLADKGLIELLMERIGKLESLIPGLTGDVKILNERAKDADKDKRQVRIGEFAKTLNAAHQKDAEKLYDEAEKVGPTWIARNRDKLLAMSAPTTKKGLRGNPVIANQGGQGDTLQDEINRTFLPGAYPEAKK